MTDVAVLQLATAVEKAVERLEVALVGAIASRAATAAPPDWLRLHVEAPGHHYSLDDCRAALAAEEPGPAVIVNPSVTPCGRRVLMLTEAIENALRAVDAGTNEALDRAYRGLREAIGQP